MPISRLAPVFVCALLAATVSADESADKAHREVVMKDLFSVITLSGEHCEKVIDYEVIKPMHYVAICKNGKRYHVGVTPEGRVETTNEQSQK